MEPTPSVQVPVPATQVIVYAGFWQRFVAVLIDSSVISFAGAIIIAIIFFVSHSGASQSFIPLVVGCIGLLYQALLESSSWQGTIGKKLIGLVVTDINGNRISFLRALGRNLAKFVSYIILLIGFIMAAFTKKKQALHDMMAGTLVVKKQPAKVGAALLVLFGPSILAGIIGFYLVTTLLLSAGFAAQTAMNNANQENSMVSDSVANQPNTPDQPTTAPETTSTLPATGYAAAFAKVSAPTISDVNADSSDYSNSVGPVLAHFSPSDLSGDFFVLTLDVGNVGDLSAKGATVNVGVTHIYNSSGIDMYDSSSKFETDTFFTNADMSQLKTNDGSTYYEGTRQVHVKSGANLTSKSFSSISGTIMFTLPTSDGSPFTKSYPFTINAN